MVGIRIAIDAGMQPILAEISTFGSLNPALVMAISLIVPAVATLVAVLVFRKVTRASWRGYWDVV